MRSPLVPVCFCLLLWPGCGRRQAGPELATVTGQVTLDGQPVGHGNVYFYPDSAKGTTGPMSMSEISPQGHYEIKSAGARAGAVIGHHRVRVEIRQPPKDERDTQPPLLTPERYNDPETSGLATEVRSGAKNVFDIELTSQ